MRSPWTTATAFVAAMGISAGVGAAIEHEIASPPAARILHIVLAPSDGCIIPSQASEGFTLRTPADAGAAVYAGQVVSVPESAVAPNCEIKLTFRISSSVGFFVLYDATQNLVWGPFDSHQLDRHGWSLHLPW